MTGKSPRKILENRYSAWQISLERLHWPRLALRLLLPIGPLRIESAGTQQAFRRYVLDNAPPADVAQELGITVHAVYSAKSRVVHRLRQEAAGLSDNFRFL